MRDAWAYGIVLAAGAGRRFGGPKALAVEPDGTPWVHVAVSALQAGGCREVCVVLGAELEAAREFVPSGAHIVEAAHWADGVAASVRAGLGAVAATDATVAVICPVDTPDMPAHAVQRMCEHADATTLAQATYAGQSGHPVVIGREHWTALAASLRGDRGAGPYLRAQDAARVECGDLWSGHDIDRRP